MWAPFGQSSEGHKITLRAPWDYSYIVIRTQHFGISSSCVISVVFVLVLKAELQKSDVIFFFYLPDHYILILILSLYPLLSLYPPYWWLSIKKSHCVNIQAPPVILTVLPQYWYRAIWSQIFGCVFQYSLRKLQCRYTRLYLFEIFLNVYFVSELLQFDLVLPQTLFLIETERKEKMSLWWNWWRFIHITSVASLSSTDFPECWSLLRQTHQPGLEIFLSILGICCYVRGKHVTTSMVFQYNFEVPML